MEFANEMRQKSQRDDKLRDSNEKMKEEMGIPSSNSKLALKSSNSDSKQGRSDSGV